MGRLSLWPVMGVLADLVRFLLMFSVAGASSALG
jgi:hypothetical protein